jgi:bifunctional DNA-binding transcriptional regulator/antitoxin component of YhaV-PrlF toxin-antitoxin module
MTENEYSRITTKQDNQSKEITKTFITGQNSCTLVIPKSVALEYGLTSPSHIVVERDKDGILIRKLKIEF